MAAEGRIVFFSVYLDDRRIGQEHGTNILFVTM